MQVKYLLLIFLIISCSDDDFKDGDYYFSVENNTAVAFSKVTADGKFIFSNLAPGYRTRTFNVYMSFTWGPLNADYGDFSVGIDITNVFPIYGWELKQGAQYHLITIDNYTNFSWHLTPVFY